MSETTFSIIKAGVMLSVISMMFAQGLHIAPSELRFFKERRALMLRSLVSVTFLVPLAFLLIILLFRPSRDVQVGLAILAAAPSAPLTLVTIPRACETLAYVASFDLLQALLAVITTPAILYLLSAVLGFQAEVSPVAVAKVVGLTIIAPVCLGALARTMWPGLAEKVRGPLGRAAIVLLMGLAVLILLETYESLLSMDAWSYLTMIVSVAAALAIGHLLGPTDPEEQTTLALESSTRHLGLALLIGSVNFRPERVLPVLIPYVFVSVIISNLYILWRKRTATRGAAAQTHV